MKDDEQLDGCLHGEKGYELFFEEREHDDYIKR